MEKEFIPYEQALELKELGFDEDCVAAYKTNYCAGDLSWGGVNGFVPFYKEQVIKQNESKWVKVIQAPLYQQAFRWLLVLANKDEHFSNKWTISYNEDYYSLFLGGCNMGVFKEELECLKKLIEIVKQK
jgi:hypothetical protein